MIDHDDLICSADELEPLAPSAVRLAELVGDPETPIAEIVHTLGRDPALAGSVLRQANSARFGARASIGTVQDAVVRLGPAAVLALATRAGVRTTVDRALPQFGFAEGQFWRHCVAASLAGEELRKVAAVSIPPVAATAALLHDLGKLAMARFLSDDVLRLLWCARTVGGHGSHEAELEILGVDHAEVGALIVQRWGLPESIRLGIQCHHDPSTAGSAVADAVHLAAVVASVVCPARTGLPPEPPERGAMQRTGCDEAALADVVVRVAEQLDGAAAG